MSRNFQSFQKVRQYVPSSKGAIEAAIVFLGTCEGEQFARVVEGADITAVYGSSIRAVNPFVFIAPIVGDIRVSKIIINEITPIDTLGTKDITIAFVTTDIDGNFAKTEFKYLEADSGAKVFNLADADLSLLPENLVNTRPLLFFGTDPSVGGAGDCINIPLAGKLRIMVTFELPRA